MGDAIVNFLFFLLRCFLLYMGVATILCLLVCAWILSFNPRKEPREH
jgi:hypothetical protein